MRSRLHTNKCRIRQNCGNRLILVCLIGVSLVSQVIFHYKIVAQKQIWSRDNTEQQLATRTAPLDNFLWPPIGTNSTDLLLLDWIQEYIQWHAAQRARLTRGNYQEHRFLVLRCLSVDKSCGGVSDRLKPLPLLLQLAAASNRILLIQWQRPAPLESFLVPAGALDWTVPAWMNVNGMGSRLYTKSETLLHALDRHQQTVMMTVRLQDQHGGSHIYNALEEYRRRRRRRGNDFDIAALAVWPAPVTSNVSTTDGEIRAFRRVFRSLWGVLFAPCPRVATAIRQHQERLGLLLSQPSQMNHNNHNTNNGTKTSSIGNLQIEHEQLLPKSYVAAHVRTYYGNHPIPSERRAAVARNAVNCASTLRRRQQQQQQPVLLLSDSTDILKAGLAYRTKHQLPILVDNDDTNLTVTKTNNDYYNEEPLHLDKATSLVAADYDAIFVDLYLLANADCVSHGQGGFGRFGSLLSRNASCFRKYFERGQFVECNNYWKE